MSSVALGGLFLAFLLVLLAIRIPIAIAMLLTGIGGYVSISGWDPLLNYLKTVAYARYTVYDLSVIPLFLLMGQFASRGGLATGLFRAAAAMVGHWRGGLAISAIGSCAAFGAVCGSSVATAATMGQVALPELRRYKYSNSLAVGCLAAGGTLGILIPPSVVLVIYAILAQQNISTLFMAAFVPGILAVIGYMIAIAIYVRLFPDSGPAQERSSWKQRLQAQQGVWPVLLIFLVVLGGIYGGWFTPTEAAAIGTVGTGFFAFTLGKMRLAELKEVLLGTGVTTAMIFMILLGADVMNAFLAISQLPNFIAETISGAGLPPFLVLAGILVLYLILGCVMDTMSMILLTIPIFFPVIMGLDFYGLDQTEKAIWFGILALMVVEIGMVTPPLGMNVYVIAGMARDIPMSEAFRGIVPFLISDIVRVVILVLFPSITLCLVRWLT
ncbi:TRAP transporter, DctM subunit [Pseudomonas sp. NFACC19-2]|jgi:tripartite ATP-independent transporter DctM subunit|uniref:TRAP transporter large permease protein n=1 Tax=Ectopseudomonas toyotomiensis TaxID=554344 RepID=A0AA42LJY8_9GAMM|nr:MULTISPECIES: TRAP transporter large permease [Pseudomonas]AQZ32269.1 C4-dicarboxylate ABC transporter permease [Pseudomonas sp. LPH1]MBG0845570.1 TRAP transporter large permease [Pseudomonas chengduensis]MDH0703924.1 TRAP transporter large permease [Pseudomonas toyotomiensis]QSL93983.1 TRAP transporter large permease [Pseudomonas toyotomiensis]WKC38237.1 TRAP transporter large permease [Pseudomonas chengduensis]